MGNLFGKWFKDNTIWKIVSKLLGKDVRMLMLGLDSAGKSTILYKLNLNETVATTTTTGFNVETISLSKDVKFTIWDVGGQDNIRHLWKHYFQGTEGLIYVVDSNDPSRMEESRKEFQGVLKDLDNDDIPILVLANKQDLPQAMKPADVAQKLGLNELSERQWHVQGTCATSGDGLYEGLNAFGEMMNEFQPAC